MRREVSFRSYAAESWGVFASTGEDDGDFQKYTLFSETAVL